MFGGPSRGAFAFGRHGGSPVPGQHQGQRDQQQQQQPVINHRQRQMERANQLHRDKSYVDLPLILLLPLPPHHPPILPPPCIPAEQQQSQANSENTDTADAASTAAAWKSLDIGGMQVKNLSPSIFRYTFLTTLYLNHNKLTHIDPAVSLLANLKVLDVSGNRLSALPSQIGLLHELEELLLFDNEISVLPNEVGFLYQLKELGIEGNPIAATEPFPSLMQKDGSVAIIQYLRDNCPVGQPPPERDWISLDDSADVNQYVHDSYTILCYNTLCDKYATPQSYAYTPSWVLSWEYRRELIMQEILNYNADIVCLQEVESSQYDEYFRDQMSQHGEYDGVFYPKSRARTMDQYARKSVDGCATFWKINKFSLVEKKLIEFQQIAMQRPELRKTEDVYNRVMIKDNIAVVTFLEAKGGDENGGSRLIVANAHLHWDPQYKDVKLVQTAMLVEELSQIAQTWAAKGGRGTPTLAAYAKDPTRIPLIISGDFNSMPSSGVYEFLTSGVASQDHPDFSTYKYGRYTSEGLVSRLSPLKSAYSHIQEARMENGENGGDDAPLLRPGAILWTNYTPGFRGVIDYIWYSTTSTVVTGLLAGVEPEYARGVVGFPNWHHPSDHIPIVVSFRIKPIKE